MVPRWVVVDKLVHELGSVRATVQEVEAQPDLAQDDVALQLRASLARAADTIHLVIGGNEDMLAQAWRTIAEAQEIGARARLALDRSRATNAHAQTIRDHSRAHGRQTRRHIDELHAASDGHDTKRSWNKETRQKD